ncbi:hypothetical protein MRX96_038616 [Rhipicephalus microplus]
MKTGLERKRGTAKALWPYGEAPRWRQPPDRLDVASSWEDGEVKRVQAEVRSHHFRPKERAPRSLPTSFLFLFPPGRTIRSFAPTPFHQHSLPANFPSLAILQILS